MAGRYDLMCPIIDKLIVVVVTRAEDDTDMYMKENIKRWFLLHALFLCTEIVTHYILY